MMKYIVYEKRKNIHYLIDFENFNFILNRIIS
jgi:hypothetical protein